VIEGISSEYEIPNMATESAWSPFQRTKTYDIPDGLLEQYNRAQVSTSMGLFAEINHAYITIDNAFYYWDYTNPNAVPAGYEEQPHQITAVKIVKPKGGVFSETISHLLILATTESILLLAVSVQSAGSGVRTMSLFRTEMALVTRGMNIQLIEASNETGRIFFSCARDTDVYELTYQNEEKWFSNKVAKINHTSNGYTSIMPVWNKKNDENIVQIVVDDSRQLIYTLSSESSIRTFYMDTPTTLQHVIEKKRQECLRDISHMLSASGLLNNTLRIVTINAISAQEGSKLHLMATTSTGCRLFLSATRGYGYSSGQGAPQSMQVQHIKFPPSVDARPPGGASNQGADPATDTSSASLTLTRKGLRFPPGLFFCFVSKQDNPAADSLFLSAPDTGRISAEARALSAQASRYYETGCWIPMGGRAEAIGLVTPPFAAANQPLGFGNELAVQFHDVPAQVAILTNSGVHIIQRRRLVDIFVSAIRSGGGDDGLELEIKRFIRQYGRGETTATALAVACGQGNDLIPGDNRIARVNDPETLKIARRAFIEYGGRPSLNENSVSEGLLHAADNVRPSSRHEGLAIYMARLIRPLWKTPVIKETILPNTTITILSPVKSDVLHIIQEELVKLATFLEENKTFIEGLSGPDSLQHAASQAEQVALQGEHQALYSMQKLNSSVIEGISFVQMLFEERVEDIWRILDDSTKQRFRDLSFETLFSTDQGKDLAKILVKAIVNRNIANGSNVDTVADALRRRCGSFCSADDVIIFKAQEQLQKAVDPGSSEDMIRNLLNESLRLFQQVAGSLSFQNLQSAVDQFTSLQFFAGAINLSLLVAKESDRGNKAQAWLNEGQPQDDPRSSAYNFRLQCYDLVHRVLRIVDDQAARQPDVIDGRTTLIATKRIEAHTVIDDSDDELFQFNLYEWYLSEGWEHRLLAVDSPFVVQFLTRSAPTDLGRSDLLWRFYMHREHFYEAAAVQLDLAKSEFVIPLARRIEYLGRAKTNASTQSPGIGRQARQMLLYEIGELLDVANLQDELLGRLRVDTRMPTERGPQIIQELDNQILNLSAVSLSTCPTYSNANLCYVAVQRLCRASPLL
jgi:nuclear pore complex protein Nup155